MRFFFVGIQKPSSTKKIQSKTNLSPIHQILLQTLIRPLKIYNVKS
jgi:hypothetical protein